MRGFLERPPPPLEYRFVGPLPTESSPEPIDHRAARLLRWLAIRSPSPSARGVLALIARAREGGLGCRLTRPTTNPGSLTQHMPRRRVRIARAESVMSRGPASHLPTAFRDGGLAASGRGARPFGGGMVLRQARASCP
jgi:hypothetical protein